ncbi:uncharacterized mitochondrial protein AtMg00810-like [Rhododendron vialii]|uniref:uncharacterized mitochondrial protein AtMg00810-like n=1 Tax=Rhododendron vialii TaxID=182163 RepID=UPI00265F792C|nr:uncharacterized mitochondrial protein AtMg00810-like [Rhododendron vialii]
MAKLYWRSTKTVARFGGGTSAMARISVLTSFGDTGGDGVDGGDSCGVVGGESSLDRYAKEILHKAGLSECKPCSSPSMVKASVLPSDSSAPFAFPALFRSIVGALQYLTITRPGIAFSVNQACQHMHAPTVANFAAVKRLLRYLKGTLEHGLVYQPSFFALNAYSDSDWAGNYHDHKSSSGYYVFLGDNLISWSAKKQTTVSRSSTEAEYRSLAHTAAELSWL